ncbi:MAG: TolC family protein [Treponema sp.]|nr:TolC family protein [Treponema sp.]
MPCHRAATQSPLLKRIIASFLLIAAGSLLFAGERTSDLLEGYLRNSLTVKKLTLSLKDRMLSRKSSAISNGIAVQLSSGSVVINTAGDGSLSLRPSASVGYPAARNLKLGISSNLAFSDGEKKNSSTSLSLSLDLYSGVMEERNIALLKADRSVLEAQRALADGLVKQEQAFYTELKSLFDAAAKLTSAENTLWDDKLSFQEVRVKGYEATSLKYRQAETKVKTDEHNVSNYRRGLEKDIKLFARKCGAEYKEADPLDWLPDDIPKVEGLDIQSFSEADYSAVESAVWTNKINSLSRKANKPFSLSANGGYTFGNSSAAGSDTVDGGLDLALGGGALSAGAGISVPVTGDDHSPVYTMNLSLNPTKFMTDRISRQQQDIAEDQEMLDIRSARDEWEHKVEEKRESLENLLWSKKGNEDSYELYKSLEADTLKWYKAGMVTEGEYRSAQTNMRNYRIQMMINDLELLIYNAEVKLLFVRDEELSLLDEVASGSGKEGEREEDR